MFPLGLKVISTRPVLIEAVKAAIQLGLKDQVRELLPKEDHWILTSGKRSFRSYLQNLNARMEKSVT
jgi:hypothetical protein